MKILHKIVFLVVLSAVLLGLSACREGQITHDHNKVATVYRIFDIRSIGSGGNDEDYNDIVRLHVSLQGKLNKQSDETGVYLYQMYDQTDEFWLSYIQTEGKLLANSETIDIRDFAALWDVFGKEIIASGIVVWDPNVPATSNVAATICSVDGFLPVRYDTDADSLYSWLVSHDVPVKLDLCGMFSGETGKTIADTDIPSTGSKKCDPYLWALERYFDRCNPSMIAYVLDGASQVASNPVYQNAGGATSPNFNQIYSHDYYIYNECFFFVLTCTSNEAPCDDPTQKLGTDYRTLIKILTAVNEKNEGKMAKLMGFPPWYMKYTTHLNNGSVEPVALEWNFTSLISEFSIAKEADAAHPSWMTNASVYCQYEPTVEKYVNNDPPAPQTYDPNVRYFTFYIGDYDSSAWLKHMVPDCFTQGTRGELPLMWAFNPNLSDRVPMIFDYVYENKTDLDYFITGDSGAGYVMPTFLPKLKVWTDYNKPYLEKFDMDIVGFIIDKSSLTLREFKAYSGMGIKGAFYNNYSEPLFIYGDTVYMRMSDVAPDDGTAWLDHMYNTMQSNGTNFASFRTVRLYTDHIVKSIKTFLDYANSKNDGYTYKYVDMYTLFDLALQSGQGTRIVQNNK